MYEWARNSYLDLAQLYKLIKFYYAQDAKIQAFCQKKGIKDSDMTLLESGKPFDIRNLSHAFNPTDKSSLVGSMKSSDSLS